ncbi:amidohydrolase [Polymorphobacter sp.]|uniref:amidohydrolase n=1 Tax=Polymorphobacter sp. TaxID=1909290 RepID=UPI003F6F2A08
MGKTGRLGLVAVMALASTSGSAQMADLIYTNGKVVTVNAKGEIAQAVAVSGDKVLAVGSAAAIAKLKGPSTRVVDLGGKTMVPGFYDNHIHLSQPLLPWKYNSMLREIPAWLVGVETIPALLDAVKAQAAKTPKGGWVIGEVNREDWPNSNLPTAADFDRIAPDHKVIIIRGPHTLLVNTATLAAAKVTKDTHPKGGEIVRDANGVPTGKVTESARRIIWAAVPPELQRGAAPPAETMANWNKMLRQLVSLGITSANVAAIRPDDFPMLETVYTKYGDDLPRLTTQFRVWPGTDKFEDMEESVRVSIAEIEAIDPKAVFKHPKLKMGALKMNIDGGMSAPVFWSTKGYENRPDFIGEQLVPDSNFYRTAKRAAELGWQIGVHTMGDGAAVMITNEMARIIDGLPKGDHRFYLHHFSVKPPEVTLDKMVKYNIGVASQPGFLLSLGSYADEALETEREETQNPVASLVRKGIRVSFGSDAGPYGPIAGIYAAVTRKSWNGTVKGLKEEGVSVADALRMHTLEAAYLTFDDKKLGSIEPGKAADFAVLSADLMTVAPERIQDIQVERTIIGGREVYNRAVQSAGL